MFGPHEPGRYDNQRFTNRGGSTANDAKSPVAKCNDAIKPDAAKHDDAKTDGQSSTAGLEMQQGWIVVALVGLFVSLGANIYRKWLFNTH